MTFSPRREHPIPRHTSGQTLHARGLLREPRKATLLGALELGSPGRVVAGVGGGARASRSSPLSRSTHLDYSIKLRTLRQALFNAVGQTGKSAPPEKRTEAV